EDAIVVPAITVENFKLKHGLLTLVQNKQFFGHDKEDLHAHIRYFNKIASTLKFSNVPNTSIKLMLFPFSLEGAARIWLEKEPPRSIFTQLDTFYNALNSKDQDSLNSVAGGNFLDRMPRECLGIIESKSKVRYSRNKPVVAKVSTTASTSSVSPDVAELKDMVRALLLDKKATDGNNSRDNIQEFVSQASVVNFNQGNTGYRPQIMSNHIRPPGFPPVPNNQNLQRNNQNRFIPNQNQNRDVQPQAVHPKPVTSPISEPIITPVSSSRPNPQAPIPYSSGRNDERNRERAKDQ
nr:reverse transcriptase domain-containing protein [Tanacetum cinerariifolium]